MSARGNVRVLAVGVSAAAFCFAAIGNAAASADVTSNNVSLHVTGTGLHVDQVVIYAGSPTNNHCLDGRLAFTHSGMTTKYYYGFNTTGEPCGQSDSYTLAKNTTWPDGTKVCATFTDWKTAERWGGEPCATIHS